MREFYNLKLFRTVAAIAPSIRFDKNPVVFSFVRNGVFAVKGGEVSWPTARGTVDTGRQDCSETILVLVDALATAEAGEVLEFEVLASGVTGSGLLGNGTGSVVDKLEGQVTDQFATNSTAVQLDAEGIGDNDTVGIIGALALTDQGGGSQVGIRVLQLAVKGNTELALVGRSKRGKSEGLLEVGARGDGASFLGLETSDLAGELVVSHGQFNVLDDGALDVLDGLLAAVVDGQVALNLFTVVEQFLVEGQLHVELARGQSEALGHEGAGLTLAATSRGILDLPGGERDGVALVGALVGVITNVNNQLIDDTKRLGGIFLARVELNGGGGGFGDGNSEWVGISSELLQESILNSGGLGVVSSRVDLLAADGHLLAEVEAHDLIFLATESVRDRDGGVNPTATEVIIIADYDAIDGFSSDGIVDKVTTT